MKFRYTALTGTNQKAEGMLEAASMAAAQEELHKMGLSIIAIQEIAESEYALKKTKENALQESQGVKTFTFKATDPTGQNVEGTIDAESDEAAYRRLALEYHFKINELASIHATAEEITQSKERLKDLQKELGAEEIKTDFPRGSEEELEIKETEVNQEWLKEIDKIIEVTEKVLLDHQALFTSSRLQEIQTMLAELKRIRTSNNIQHIAEVSDRLFKAIHEPDQAASSAAPENYTALVGQISSESLFFKKRQAKDKRLGLSHLQKILVKLKSLLLFWKKRGPQKDVPPSSTPLNEPLTLGSLGRLFFATLFAPNPLARNMRRHEFQSAWEKYKADRKRKPANKPSPEGAALSAAPETAPPPSKTEKGSGASLLPLKTKPNFGHLFMEIDSFVSWLLFFYCGYFYLVSFSLEKKIGLPDTFVLKTLQSSLLFNIALFLLWTHFLLKLKLRLFHQNFLGSVFLFLFGYGLWVLLISNF